MTTVRRKLEGGEYADAKGFYNDVQLIIRNCMTFNPAGSPVRACGEKLAHVFEDKWASLPPLRRDDSPESESDGSPSDAERDQSKDFPDRLDELDVDWAFLRSDSIVGRASRRSEQDH